MSESREIIRQLCETHGYATVLDDVRAALECTLERLQEADSREEKDGFAVDKMAAANCELALENLALVIPPAELIPTGS